MTERNTLCADAGTVNCPCPLAETGDCLICSRLAGKDCCDCSWSGVCVYNEYIQNGSIVRNRREGKVVPILKKTWYGKDLLVLVLQVSRGFALQAAQPGSFVFLRAPEGLLYSDVPVSVMKVEIDDGRLYLALKIFSGKTKAIASEQNHLFLRGVYRNGLLGKGVSALSKPEAVHHEKWLILTRGTGFAPAVNLLQWLPKTVSVDLVTDPENIEQELIRDYLECCPKPERADDERNQFKMKTALLMEAIHSCKQEDYDRIVILASDYFIGTIARQLEIPLEKLIFSNNFHMCCGEGICGACSHVTGPGEVKKMCKCRLAELKHLG